MNLVFTQLLLYGSYFASVNALHLAIVTSQALRDLKNILGYYFYSSQKCLFNAYELSATKKGRKVPVDFAY